MPRNGNGVFSPPAASFPAVASTLIESAKYNAVENDVASALTQSIATDGQSVITGNIPFSNNKITGLAAATARTDAASLATIQDGTGVYVATVGGTADVITLSPSPAITAYVAGQEFSWIASGANTTNVTVNVSTLGAKAVTKNGSAALIAGDIPSGWLVTAKYDGTRFQLTSSVATAFNGGTVANATTFSSTVALNGATTATADMTMSGAMLKWAKGADVASATALPLITDGNYFDVTGTTTITSFNSVGVGTWIRLHFDGALILTHNATDLILPGGANITTAAGDEAEFIEYASGDYRCVSYTKASGLPVVGGITLGSPTATTSGTSHDYTGIPAGAKRITLMLSAVSTNGTSNLQVQLGSGSVETSGYNGFVSVVAAAGVTGVLGISTGFPIDNGRAAPDDYNGTIVFTLLNSSTNLWTCSGNTYSASAGNSTCGSKALSGTLDRIRVTTVSGADTFDAGSINILIE